MQFVNLQNDQKISRMVGGHSKLENLLYDPNTGILALSSADKRISLINTNDFDEKPLVIEEHSLNNCKVKCMGFNDRGILFALTDDNKIRLWDTDSGTYADALTAMNLPPLSDTEWNLILGREFSEK
jgi:WD40 repeat protein